MSEEYERKNFCPECGALIASLTGVGRPRVYCSTRCRRNASEARRAALRGNRPVQVYFKTVAVPVPDADPVTKVVVREHFPKLDRRSVYAAARRDPGFLPAVMRLCAEALADEATSVDARRLIAQAMKELVRAGYERLRVSGSRSFREEILGLPACELGTLAHELGELEGLIREVNDAHQEAIRSREKARQMLREARERATKIKEDGYRSLERREKELETREAVIAATEQRMFEQAATSEDFDDWDEIAGEDFILPWEE